MVHQIRLGLVLVGLVLARCLQNGFHREPGFSLAALGGQGNPDLPADQRLAVVGVDRPPLADRSVH